MYGCNSIEIEVAMPKQLKFVVEQWVLFMVQQIFESAHHFRIDSGRPIRIWIESRSFARP